MYLALPLTTKTACVSRSDILGFYMPCRLVVVEANFDHNALDLSKHSATRKQITVYQVQYDTRTCIGTRVPVVRQSRAIMTAVDTPRKKYKKLDKNFVFFHCLLPQFKAVEH